MGESGSTVADMQNKAEQLQVGGGGRPPQLCRGAWGPGRMATLLEAACRAGAAACTIARCSAVRSSGAFWGLICLGPLPGPSTHYLFPEAALLRPTPHHLQAQLRGLISDYQGGDEGVLAQAFEAFDMLSRCAGPRCAALGVGESSGARGGGEVAMRAPAEQRGKCARARCSCLVPTDPAGVPCSGAGQHAAQRAAQRSSSCADQ